MLSHTQAAIRDVERNLSGARATFKAWQQEAKHYLDWLNSQESQQMRQLSKALEIPEVQERLLTIELGYSLHNAAQFILKEKGVQENDCRYFQGNSYRIEERSSNLTIWHQQQSQPIYQAVDARATGGIVVLSIRRTLASRTTKISLPMLGISSRIWSNYSAAAISSRVLVLEIN